VKGTRGGQSFMEVLFHLQEEIMKGLSNKQPKIVLGSIQVLKMMLQ